MAIIRTLTVLQIELVGKSLLGVVLGTNVLLLIRTIRPGTLPRVVNPADEIVVVRLFAHSRQISGEYSAHHLVAFADGVTSEASTGFEQFFSMRCVPGLVLGQVVGERRLPDVGRDRLNLMIG